MFLLSHKAGCSGATMSEEKEALMPARGEYTRPAAIIVVNRSVLDPMTYIPNWFIGIGFAWTENFPGNCAWVKEKLERCIYSLQFLIH